VVGLRGKRIVLDTSALIVGYNPLLAGEGQVTAPLVMEELRSDTTIWLRVTAARESGKLMVVEPDLLFVNKVIERSTEMGDIRHLSNADRQVLALALQLKESGENAVIISDDYSIQNVAERLGIEYEPLATFGIRYRFQWLLYCPACRRRFPQGYPSETCAYCGTQLKRRVLKKTPLTKRMRASQGSE